jgi:hypothetical protein
MSLTASRVFAAYLASVAQVLLVLARRQIHPSRVVLRSRMGNEPNVSPTHNKVSRAPDSLLPCILTAPAWCLIISSLHAEVSCVSIAQTALAGMDGSYAFLKEK